MGMRRLLVAYDEARPSAGQGDFLAVVRVGGTPSLWGVRSRQFVQTGRMVFTGKDVEAEELFARLVDSGCKIENVQQTLTDLAAYLRLLGDLKLGNVVSLARTEDEPGFALTKIADMPKPGT
jgi:hypothetical protein